VTQQAAATAKAREASLWTPPFVLLCLTVMLGYAHNAILTPIVPLYVADQGGSAFLAGLALLTFSVPSFIVRPWVGHMADAWSAAGVLTLGLLLLATGGFIYLTSVLAMVFVAGVFRGLGWAGLNTGGYTLLAAAAPQTRRGEASGYYTSVTSSASVLFPALALWIIEAPGGSFAIVFLLSGLVALAGVPLCHLVLGPMSRVEPSTQTEAAAAPAGERGIAAMIDRGVLLATVLNLCSSLSFPAVGAFLPLYARELGIGNIGLFYVVAGVTSIALRPMLGRRSDSMGRGPAIALGFVSMIAGLVLILFAQNLLMILLGGVFMSLGSAINSSATTALAMDLANPARRGKAMATFSISFQLGAGVGAIVAGGLADLVGYQGMYAGSIAIILAGLVVLAASWRGLASRPAVTAL
jgi:MFS family permease